MANFKLNISFLCLWLLSVVYLTSAGGADKLENDFFETQDIQLDLLHSFTGAEDSFTKRGVLEVRNLRSLKMVGNQEELSVEELNKLKDLKDNDGYYFLKIKATVGTTVKSFRTFVPVRSLLDAGLSDVLTLHLSPGNELYAVTYSAAKQDINLSAGSNSIKGHGRTNFNTALQTHYGETGPVPDTAPYLEKLEHERIAKERGDDGRDNRSFLARYWMYIVPVLILVLLSGASNPEEGGGR